MTCRIGLWITVGWSRKRRHLVCMTYLNLPKNWSALSLSDPELAADVVDLFVNEGERRRGVFTALICDEQDRYLAAIGIDLSGHFNDLQPSDCAVALKPVLGALQEYPRRSLLLALGRPGPPEWPEVDTEWAEAATHICQAATINLLGFYIASPTEVHALNLPAVSSARLAAGTGC